MLKAYLDDYNLIRIESDKRDDQFWIWDQKKTFDYTVGHVYPLGDVIVYELWIDFEISLSVRYYIYNQRGLKNYLVPRNILKSQRFSTDFYTNDHLGSFYSKSETTFRIWAPLSSTVMVIIDSPDRKYKQSHLMQKLDRGVYALSVPGDFDGWTYLYLVKNFGQWTESRDPYGKASRINSISSSIINLKDTFVPMEDFPIDHLPIEDAIIYEIHVRDFSINPDYKFTHSGKFLAFLEEGLVNSHGDPIGIDYLKSLGVTHVQLMPIFDFSSVTDFEFDHFYNWGYDPEQLNVIAGRYATNPDIYYQRIVELKQLVNGLKSHGIGVIMDVVYNHVHHADTFAFEKIVPGYYFRKDDNNHFYNGSGTGNDVATERSMVSRYIIDSLVYWMTEFKINGFRFDLMGLIDIETIKRAETKLRSINPNVYLYGEGWTMSTGLNSSLLANSEQAHQFDHVGFFNAFFRDIVKGSTFNLNERGLASGNTYLLGATYDIFTASIQNTFKSPSQSINYISCHDNQTLYDRLKHGTDDEKMILSYQKLAYAFLLFSQGVPFMHAGCEFSRTKNGIDNSYNLSDSINQINWDLISSNRSLVDFVKKLIHIRKEHGAFRLKSRDEILEHVQVSHDGRMIYYHIRDVKYCSAWSDYFIIFNITPYTQTLRLEEFYNDVSLDVSYRAFKSVSEVEVLPFGIKLLVK